MFPMQMLYTHFYPSGDIWILQKGSNIVHTLSNTNPELNMRHLSSRVITQCYLLNCIHLGLQAATVCMQYFSHKTWCNKNIL